MNASNVKAQPEQSGQPPIDNSPDERVTKYAPVAQEILQVLLKHNVTVKDREFIKGMVNQMWMNLIQGTLRMDLEESFEIAFHSLNMNYQRALKYLFEADPVGLTMGDIDKVLKEGALEEQKKTKKKK
jgi:hypothetical protein